MNDEEKRAIEYIKNCLNDEYDFKNATRQKDKESHNIILNLIEKQQKEIVNDNLMLKRSQKIIGKKQKEIEDLTTYILAQIGACPVWKCGEPYSNYISKDKIKAILEEYKYTEIGDSEKIIEFYKKVQSLLEKEYPITITKEELEKRWKE